ncbi:MAG TPA: uracil-DNA glycosylase family protein [Clostridium sp.]|uniref:uracil-DNA glycosylase family protein n=1 Tax=Clostridium sp. TaxID=1506 RepID=UPI002F94B07A
MNNLVDGMLDLYNKIKNVNELKMENITVLNEFVNNKKFIRKFYEEYVDCNVSDIKVVMCGINPGRYGAGKTGIPFIDFNSLSELLLDVQRNDSERSAEYFYSVIKKYGAKKFYSNIYVTNICSVGFLKDNKNFNYYQLPENIKEIIHLNFLEKIKIVNPKVIIPLSKDVDNTLKYLQHIGELKNILIDNTLNHPFFCSMRSNWEIEFNKYIDKLDKYII